MNNKKILSIITLAGLASIATQSITANIPQSSNKILMINRGNNQKNTTSDNKAMKDTDTNIDQGFSNKLSIENNTITINNVWRQNIGYLKFNPETSKIEFIKGWAESNPYLSANGEEFSISLYKSNGELIKSVQVNGGGEYPENKFYNAFNNLSYSYGDILEINYKQSSKISISNFNGQKNYEVNKPISMEITKGGLKELSNNLIVNPIYFDLGSNKINVSGKAIPNSVVNIWVYNKDYITTANSNGEYNLDVNANKNITTGTIVRVFNEGNVEVQESVELNPNNYKLNYTSISLNGYWGGAPYLVSKIGFNQYTKKLEVENKGKDYFSWSPNNPAYEITLLNKNGEVIKSESYNGSGCSQNVYNDFNGLSFEYGDSIEITSYGLDMSLNNPNGKVDNMPGNSTRTVEYEITQEGLKEAGNNLTVNPIYFDLGSNKIDVSGETIPNTMVNIWVEGKDYTTTSNSQGKYNLNIEADKDITTSTKIEVFVEGEQGKFLTPIINPNIYKIIKNNITLIGNWYGGMYKAANISFDPEDMKLNVTGNMGDYFASGSGKAFEISLYSKNGSLIKTETYNNSSQTENLYNDFNNLGFSYGDIIKVSSLGEGELKVSNYDGQNSYLVNKSVQMTITKNGLVPCNFSEIKINPFDVLGSGKVTSGTLTGTIAAPNQTVYVTIDGKTFSGKSNDKGDFSINISDSNGFTNTTNILVETSDEIATVINPTANTKLGILNSNILVHGEDGVIAQEVSFNPANMTVVKSAPWGNNFAAQLINGKTGAVIASCGTGDFTAYTSKNNLNGAHFQYGDIISVYETEQMKLTNGSLLLLNGKTGIDCVDCFKSFRITPNGLVPVENKNLTTSQVLYTGTKNLNLTGKTLPNTNVTVSYGDITKVVKSNSNGDFSLEIPFSDTQIGKEVRVFVNNENNENLIVKYDSKLININANRIEVLNNTNLPIFNISFDPLTNKLSAVPYPGGMTYTGVFFENALNIKLINPTSGKTIYSFNGNKLNNISDFIANINGKSYKQGDIIEVSYNPTFVKTNVYDGKTSIGNTNGSKEYFEITNKGLVNLNDKFVNIKPLNILSSSKVTAATVEGQVKPNSSVEISINGDVFKGTSGENGNFSIPITDKNGFTSNTNIVVSSEGYIPTTINPTMESTIGLQNSYINFYNSQGSYGQISSSIGFNPETMEFVVNNYANSFGKGDSHYFNFDLYSNNGKELLNASINNGATSAVTNAINNKSFNYGDIIGLSYNSEISKPAILNGNQVLGNVNGEEEYFKITKSGLVPVNFGQNAYTNNVYWNDSNLIIDSNLADGQKEDVLNANKKLVILNSNGQVIDSVNTSELNNNLSSVQGVIKESVLDKLHKGENYTFALDINNELFSIKVASNVQSNSKYLLEGNENNVLSISTAIEPVVTISNSNEISDYLNKLNSDIKSQVGSNINSNTMNNSKLNSEIIAREFITRIGVNNLESLYNKSDANKAFVNWVLNNDTAMEQYLEGTNPTGINVKALQVWSDIWNKYTNSRSGFNLKLAIATAISNANPIMAWPSTHYYGYGDTVTVGSPVERYNIFETLNAEGGMLPIFKTLDVKHLEYVVDTNIANSQIMELRSIIMQNHNGYVNSTNSGLNNIAYTIDYEMHNPHTGQSVDANSDFYGPHPNMADIWYDGGVCYSIALLGAAACQVFGIPAQPETQDAGAHKVFIYYNNNKEWNIGNNIFGLSKTFGGDISGWSNGIATGPNTANYDWLYEKANTPALIKSNEYLWLASSDISYQDKMNAINEAIKIQPLNLRAWLDKIALMKKNHTLTVQAYVNLYNEIINTFKDYPMPMYDALLQLKDVILSNGTTTQYSDYINSIKKALNSVTNSQQAPIAKNLINSMSQQGLVNGETPLINSKINISNVWNQALGTIGFNPINMQITVNKGWSEVNPYLNGEAFSIGLYNKDNELIKSLTLKGGEYPANSLYNTFNSLGFKYGDKIYIDYKISSKVSVSHVYKNGVLDNSYNVNKTSVFEITPRGLVYLGNNLQDSLEKATLNISTVYSNGEVVKGDKYNYKETGLIGDSIKNESIPTLENYHIDYVTVNGVKTDINQLPKYYLGNNMNIVYHMASDSEYKLNIDVKTEDGKVLNTMPVTSYAEGDKISISDNNWDKKEYKLDYILVDGVKTPADKLPIVMPGKNLNITYVVEKISGITQSKGKTKVSESEKENHSKNTDNTKTSSSKINHNTGSSKNDQESYKSKTEDIYWDNNSLVINGDIILNNKEISKNTPKEIIIKNSKGNIVASSNTVAVNWYSKDKNDYTGYQGIFTNEQLSNLNPNEIYNVYIKMDGTEVPISNNIVLKSDKNYTIASKNDELTIESNMKKVPNGAIYETDYFTDYGYVLNGNLYLNNTVFNKSDSKMLVIKDANGNVVDKVKCVSMNWYSSNSNNYSGFQGIFTNSELNKLKAGEKYSFEIEVNQNGKTYTFPIKNKDNFTINTDADYNIATNSENDLTIVKKIQNESISSGKTTVEDEYWEPYGYVMNIKVGDNKEIPKGTKMQLISKDSSGKVVLVVNGVDVNWYSNNEENYNGFQVIIAHEQVNDVLGKNKLYAKVILNGHIQEFAI